MTGKPERVELTDAIIEKATCPEGKAQAYLRDSKQGGFAVRVRASGAKTYVLEHTRPGHKGTFRTTIIAVGKITLAEARRQAKILAGKHAMRTDLVVMRREEKQAAAAKANAATLGALIAGDGAYEASLKARGVVNTATALSALRRNLLPAHKLTDLRELTRLDITSAMGKLTDAGKPGAAADLRKHANTFLVWAQGQGHVDHNVLAGFRQPKQTRAQRLGRKSKQRALPDDEIKQVWDAAGRLGAFGLLVRLCLLGGPRRSEPTFVEWKKHVMADRLTFDENWTKMGLHHDIPHTALVDQVLDDAKRFQRATADLVFPGQRGTPISGFTKLVDRLVKESGTAKWTMHDLRRTLRTVMSKCGYDNDIQRLCIGQKPRGIDQVYNKDEAWAIRKMAFEAAHAYIAAVIEGKSTEAVLKHQRAVNPQNARKIELLARLAALHAEG
ncbi:tyrosine-type recombinase/integrase [Bradyrhizobium sp. UFLA05-112]